MEYFDDFANHRYENLQKELEIDKDLLGEIIDEITALNPRPGEGYRDKFQTVIPDVIVRMDGDNWVITTNDGGIPELRISAIYKEQIVNNKLKKDAKKYIKEKCIECRNFKHYSIIPILDQ